MAETIDDLLNSRIDSQLDGKVAAALTAVLAGFVKGNPGEPGRGVTGVEIGGGNLVLTFSDGTDVDLGRVVGKDGEDGDPGEPGSGGSFPPWQEAYAAFQTARAALSTRLRKLPAPSGAKLIMPDVTFPGTNSNFFGDVLRMADGDSYFFVPCNATSARIYRNRTRTWVTPTGSYAGGAGYNGGALMMSKRIVLAPYQAGSLVAFNPQTEAVDTLQAGLTGTYKYSGVAVSGNLAVFAPHNAGQAGVWDEQNGAWALASGSFTVQYGYCGALSLPDGKVLFVPHMATKAAIFDPAANAVTFGAAIFPGAESFFGAHLVDDCHAILFPHKHDRPVIYNFVNDTVVPFPTAIGTMGVANFAGGVPLGDGRFFVVPFQSTSAKIIDLVTNTAITCPGTYGSGACHGGALMDDGDVIMAPFNSANGLIAATGNGVRLDPEFVTSPFVNHV